jgi:hypothetical protein
MARLFEVVIVLLILWLLCGCGEYRPSIVDIREEPTPIDWSPRQPEKFRDTVMQFEWDTRSFYKFQEQLQKQREVMR